MLTNKEIMQFIDDDRLSEKKLHAKEGLDYYEGKHSILDYKLYYFNADGNLVEDKTRSNIKIPHPFFTEIVDQQVQYMLSGCDDGFVFSDEPELQQELDEYFNNNEDFIAELNETLTGCISKGFEYMYAYKNEEGKTSFQCADSMGVIDVEAKYTSDNRNYMIYWYMERINKEKEPVRRIQVWDDNQTYYYTQVANKKIELDESTPERPNPRPHVLYKKGNNDDTYYEGLGLIPFFRLDNNKKQFSGLMPIKSLIDDYDLQNCSLSNNLQDLVEGIYVVKGFDGDNMDELITNLKTKKLVGVGEGGDVDIKTVDIPYQARQIKMDIDEKNIYKFGMGLNTSGLKDTAATTNIAIKSAYSLLDLKANKLEIKLKQFLRKILKVVLKEINDENGTEYQQKDVYFKFEREVPTNAEENARIEEISARTKQIEINTLLGLASTLDDETIVQNICDVLDIDYEDIKNKLPKNEEALLNEVQNDLESANVDE